MATARYRGDDETVLGVLARASVLFRMLQITSVLLLTFGFTFCVIRQEGWLCEERKKKNPMGGADNSELHWIRGEYTVRS